MQTQIFNAITYYFLFSVCSWVYLLLRLLLVHLKTCLERFLIKNISIIWAWKNEIYVLFFMLGWNLLWKKIYSNWKFILISFFLYLYFEILSKALSFVIIFRSKVNTQYADRLVDNLMMTLYDNILGLVLFFLLWASICQTLSILLRHFSIHTQYTFFPIIQCLCE